MASSSSNARPSAFRVSRKSKHSVRFRDDVTGGAGQSFDYTASSVQMQQCGIPEDYVDALLDETYMNELIQHTGKLNKKRERRMERYQRLNRVIFIFLCLQAVLGIVVALYKTVLQPAEIVMGRAYLPNVDLVMALDAAGHMKSIRNISRDLTLTFAHEVTDAMGRKRNDTTDELVKFLDDQEREAIKKSFIRSWIPFATLFLPPIVPNKEPDVRGGFLQVGIRFFNAVSKLEISPMTKDMEKHEDQFRQMDETGQHEKMYKSTATWMQAMKGCKESLEGNKGRQTAVSWCVILADSEVACEKQVIKKESAVSKFCQKHPKLCPPPKDLDTRGSPLEKGMEKCIEYVRGNSTEYTYNVDSDKLPEVGTKINLAIILHVKNDAHAQQRLEKQDFRNFITKVTDCDFNHTDEVIVDNTTGMESVKSQYVPNNNNEACKKFIMGSELEDLQVKAKEIAGLLVGTNQAERKDNQLKNPNYYLFLLLCLNLPLYIIWSKIVQCGQRVQTELNRQMGVKKKMIKVTKTLIEKEQDTDDIKDFKSQLTEVEMAEVQRLNPHVELGSQMTLRARLKGGYLRSNDESRTADGNGNIYDLASNWTFEAVDPVQSGTAGEPLHCGHPVVLKNSNGDLLSMDETGVSILPGKLGATGSEANSAPPEISAQFVIEPVANEDGDGSVCRLGDFIQVRSLATGKLIRVHKDGHCDGEGSAAEPETQFSIDRGGKPINSGTIVALKAHATQEYLHGGLEGQLSADEGGDGWKYWMLERKADLLPDGDLRKSCVAGGPLKEGEIVTLKGINQKYMELDSDGKGACKNTMNPELTQEFIVERLGMGLKKHDNTIRSGTHLCLKPVPKSASSAGSDNTYVKVSSDGSITGDGRVTSPDIGFTLELPDMSEMVDPLDDVLTQGDCTLLMTPLWNKNETKRCEALSASWTTDEQLSTQFKGNVVVANDQGQYTVPKAKGEGFQGWVAVVKDNVNIAKAAKQAKAQGATGLIVRCKETLTINKLSKTSGEDVELPVVFVDDQVGEEVSERGMVLKGIESKGKHLTEAMRSVAHMSKTKSRDAVKNVFDKVGNLMVYTEEDRLRREAAGEFDQPVAAAAEQLDDDEQGNFKWKVSSNTHYLWSKGGGGAGKMNVNFGKKAPPSAHKETKLDESGQEVRVNADASQNKVYKGLIKKRVTVRQRQTERKSVVGSAFIPADDIKNKRKDAFGLNQEEEVTWMDTHEQGEQALQQLPDESDFKIQYEFQELEVAAGESVEDLEDITHIDDEGATVGRFAVPVKRFWLVCLGMMVTTMILVIILYCAFYPNTINRIFGWKEEEPAEKPDEVNWNE